MAFTRIAPLIRIFDKYAKPGIQDMPWGSKNMTISDPFGNKINKLLLFWPVIVLGFFITNMFGFYYFCK